MKNFLLALLVIGLLVSLYFNWKGYKVQSAGTNTNSIRLDKDSFRLVFYLKKPESDSSKILIEKMAGPLPSLFSTVPPCLRLGCEDDQAVGTPPWGIIGNATFRNELMKDMSVLKKYYPKLEKVTK